MMMLSILWTVIALNSKNDIPKCISSKKKFSIIFEKIQSQILQILSLFLMLPFIFPFLFSYPTSGVKKELRDQFMWFADKISSASDKINKTSGNSGCSNFVPDLAKKQVWEKIYQDTGVPVVSNYHNCLSDRVIDKKRFIIEI